VHSSTDHTKPCDFSLNFGCTIYVNRRPGVQEFIRWLHQPGIEVVIFTASTLDYASCVVKDLDPSGVLVRRILCRDDCMILPGSEKSIKDLKKITLDFRRIVLVDNTPLSFYLQPRNGILVKDWRGGFQDDNELYRVRRILQRLLHVDDVREALQSEAELTRLDKLLPQLCWDGFATCAECGIIGATDEIGASGHFIGDWICQDCLRTNRPFQLDSRHR